MDESPGAAAARHAQTLLDAGARLAWVLRDLLEALPPIDPESEFHGQDDDLSRSDLMEVLPGIGVAARGALTRWEEAGGTFEPVDAGSGGG